MQYTAKLYGKHLCPKCAKTRTALSINGIPFQYIEVTDSDEIAAKVIDLWEEHGQDASLPLVYINSTFVGGYSETVKFISDNFSK